MSMFKRKKQPPIKSLVACGSELEGQFNFTEGLRVDGVIRGNITGATASPSMLVISESAQVCGAVVADHIIINGRVEGPVRARELLELQPKAHIVGDVSYKSLEMHRGAVVEGRLTPFVAVVLDEDKPTLKLAANNQ